MKHLISICIAGLLVVGCEKAATAKDPISKFEHVEGEMPTPNTPKVSAPLARDVALNMSGYSYELAKFMGLKMGSDVNEVYQHVHTRLVGGETGKGREDLAYREHLYEMPTELINVYTVNNQKDDSVKATELKVIFHHDGANTFKLIAYGMRQKCWRAKDKEAWTTELCP